MFKNQKSQTLKTKINKDNCNNINNKKLEKHVIYSFMIILLQKNIINCVIYIII